MNDSVLHRKLFRERALRVGALKPLKYQIGTGQMGVAPITPEGPSYNPYTTKTVDGKVYSLDRMGNVIKVDYLPATIGKPQSGFGKIFQGLEAIVDPASASERGTYRKIGQAVFNPETYKSIGRGIKGLGNIVKQAPGYLAVEEAANIAGVPGEVAFPGLVASGFAEAAKGKVFQGAGIKNLLGRTAVRAVASPAVLAGAVNPYVLGAATVAAPFIAADYLSKERMKSDPAYAAQIEKQRIEGIPGEPTTDPETSMMMYGPPDKLNLKDVVSKDGGTGGVGGPPPSGSPPNVQGGVNQPLDVGIGNIQLGDFEKKIADTAEKTVSDSGIKKIDPNKKETKTLSFFDKMGDFARSASGNAFLLKFAAGLLSGKGTFGEVVGNALNPAVDLFAAYKLKEDELDNKRLLELMKIQSKQTKKSFETGSFPIIDPKTGQQSFVQAFQDKETKQVYVAQRNADGTVSERVIPLDQTNLFNQKSAELKPGLEEAFTSYGSVATGLSIIDYSKKSQVLGTSGAIKDFANTIIGIGKGVGESFSTAQPKFTDDAGVPLEGKALKKAQETFNSLDKTAKNLFDNLDKDTISELGKLRVSQTTLKYFLANAFKDKDRLTNTDLQLVAELTNLISFTTPKDKVVSNLEALESVLKEKQTQLKTKINKFGVTDSEFASAFYNTPGAIVAAGLGFTSANRPQGGGTVDFSKLTSAEREKILKNYF